MDISLQIKQHTLKILLDSFNISIDQNELIVNATKQEFTGDYTLVLFTLNKKIQQSTQIVGETIGNELVKKFPNFYAAFNIIKGFLNIEIADSYLITFLDLQHKNKFYGKQPINHQTIVLEYSSPNTNKPLHLGHLRNIFLGCSLAEILQAAGNLVIKTCVVNDRGIHICKSMIGWLYFANNTTPYTEKIKGDHFVGQFYVKFESCLKIQSKEIFEQVIQNNYAGFDSAQTLQLQKLNQSLLQISDIEKQKKIKDEINEICRNNTELMKETKTMLRNWEDGEIETITLWKKMNEWVYEGFNETYKKIGANFEKIYYESDTYLFGKKFVEEGLQSNVFYQKPDGSIWIDLTADGLDEKLVLRKDGTSVYITQDLGLAQEKFKEFNYQKSLYIIADEQNYHMKVLKLILQKLNRPFANGIEHVSYGMVELPDGRMKSREGNVVDADDIVEEMINMAAEKTNQLGKVNDFSKDELTTLHHNLGLGALKFFLLRVDPKRKIIFNPEDSIELQGFTGTFIQYTYARIQSIIRKNNPIENSLNLKPEILFPAEKKLLIILEQFPVIIKLAALEYNPSTIALYAFNLSQLFNSFYAIHSVANAETEHKKHVRIQICTLTSNVISFSLQLLGITPPSKM